MSQGLLKLRNKISAIIAKFKWWNYIPPCCMLQVHASSSPVVMWFDLVVLVALTEQRPSFKLLKSRIAYIHSRQVYQFRNQLKLFTARTCRMWLSKLCKSLVKTRIVSATYRSNINILTYDCWNSFLGDLFPDLLITHCLR